MPKVVKKSMSDMAKYMLFWFFFGAVFVSLIMYTGAQKATVVCVDGTVVHSQALCPQCTEDVHCGKDRICKENRCLAKPCLTDNDCDDLLSQCVFDKCMSSRKSIDDL
ncbi:MAG TPA: hypothetical protein VK158_02265 [Acidobacteriota bacterium]|nr:hypothetical protein [Acidobacteriota bacterium]